MSSAIILESEETILATVDLQKALLPIESAEPGQLTNINQIVQPVQGENLNLFDTSSVAVVVSSDWINTQPPTELPVMVREAVLFELGLEFLTTVKVVQKYDEPRNHMELQRPTSEQAEQLVNAAYAGQSPLLNPIINASLQLIGENLTVREQQYDIEQKNDQAIYRRINAMPHSV